MSALDDYRKIGDFVVCVDSDGCAMDTMNIKHIRCFGPEMIREWHLEAFADEIQQRWNEINLFSGTRGINRFKGLAMMLREINDRCQTIDGIDELEAWADSAPELSNDALAAIVSGEASAVFSKALAWSRAVNEAITALPEEEIRPYEGVKEALAAAHEKTDVVIVSSANPEAVKAEWTRFQLVDHVDLLCTQDMGSKAYCIGELVKKGYLPDHILMCGDAPGDDRAAEVNGVLYYPILVGHEKESWESFISEALPRFLSGVYRGSYQDSVRGDFYRNLGI